MGADRSAYMAAWREANRDRLRAYAAEYRTAHRDERIAAVSEWRRTEAGKASGRKTYERSTSIGARSARQSVYHAVRIGKMVKGPCVVCGNPDVQAHHPNGYRGAARFEVVWMCRTHHAKEHVR